MSIEDENKIIIYTEDDKYDSSVSDIIHDFRGDTKREWFIDHAYRCLPLLIGNQYGFGIKSLHTFDAVWNGGDSPKDVKVTYPSNSDAQVINSHFGMGVITVQNRFTIRTPEGVNIMTLNPANTYIDGLTNLQAVVETDNVRRDFTWNIRLTRPNHVVRVNKGDILGGFIPVPRYFVDSFSVCLAKDEVGREEVLLMRQAMRDAGLERQLMDPDKRNSNGNRYRDGFDVYGNKFKDHQLNIKKDLQ